MAVDGDAEEIPICAKLKMRRNEGDGMRPTESLVRRKLATSI